MILHVDTLVANVCVSRVLCPSGWAAGREKRGAVTCGRGWRGVHLSFKLLDIGRVWVAVTRCTRVGSSGAGRAFENTHTSVCPHRSTVVSLQSSSHVYPTYPTFEHALKSGSQPSRAPLSAIGFVNMLVRRWGGGHRWRTEVLRSAPKSFRTTGR